VPEETADDWSALVLRLWEHPLNLKEGRSVPNVAHLSPEGRVRWQEHYDAHADEMNHDDFPPSLRSAWGKFREYAGRLTLILACMEHAADPTKDLAAAPHVKSRTVRNAWRLVDYFKSHARRVHAAIAHGTGIGGGPVVQAIVGWLRDGHRLTFKVRDLKQARRWVEHDDLDNALSYLAGRNAIRPCKPAAGVPRRGRPGSQAYDVNPALLSSQNPQNPQKPVPEGDFEDSEGFEDEEWGE
jgi:hypothetical protein